MTPEKVRQAKVEYQGEGNFPGIFIFTLDADEKFGHEFNVNLGGIVFFKMYVGTRTFFVPMSRFISLSLDL